MVTAGTTANGLSPPPGNHSFTDLGSESRLESKTDGRMSPWSPETEMGRFSRRIHWDSNTHSTHEAPEQFTMCTRNAAQRGLHPTKTLVPVRGSAGGDFPAAGAVMY